MITVWKAAPAPAEDIDAYLRAQLALYAEKLALDAAGVESVVPAVAEAELATAGHDLLKIVRQLHDFFLAAAKEGGK